jgi:hypothetical protein
MRPKARGLAQHAGPLSWLEESNPAGVILCMMDGPCCLHALMSTLKGGKSISVVYSERKSFFLTSAVASVPVNSF